MMLTKINVVSITKLSINIHNHLNKDMQTNVYLR